MTRFSPRWPTHTPSDRRPYLLLVDFRYGQPTGTDLMAAGLQQMLLGKATPDQVAGSLQKGISQWYKPES